MRCRVRRIFVLGLLVHGLAGCATTSPSSQRFVTVETPRFVVASSLGEARTRALVRELEFFHAGVLAVLGTETTPPGHPPTRVVAFDDRSLLRPFAVRGAAAYLLPAVDGDWIVFRAPGDWNERASRLLRAAYAHAVVRSRSPHRLPLWVEEGLAQVASAILMEEDEIRLGALIAEHVAQVKDWRRSSLAPLLQRTDLSDASPSERERFEAMSWALVHTLMFAPPEAAATLDFPRAYLETFDASVHGEGRRAADALLGADAAELAERVDAHLDQSRFAMRVIRPLGWDGSALDLRPLGARRSRALLGELALALDRPGLAEDFFERALEGAPADAPTLVGLARARRDRFDEAEDLAQRALVLGAGDAEVRAGIGQLYADGARAARDAVERGRRLAEARAQLEASLALDPTRVQPRVDLALLALEPQGDVEVGLERLRAAAELRPGALEVDLARARLEARAGRRAAARVSAREVASRSQWSVLREQAQDLLSTLAAEGR